MNKQRIGRTAPIRRRIELSSKRHEERREHEHGHSITNRWETESAEFEAVLETYIDFDQIISKWAQKAMSNKNKRAKVGPIEVRAINVKEIEGTRQTKMS